MSEPIVLITGALTGIGRAAAFAFAKESASVVVSGRKDAEGKALEAELASLGATSAFIRTDVRHEDEVRNLVDKTVARFGRLDAAVNAAGTEGKPGPVTEQAAESYAATFDTNVLGTVRPKPACSIASPAGLRIRPRSPRACRLAGSPCPRKLPARLSSSPRKPRRSWPDRSGRWTAARRPVEPGSTAAQYGAFDHGFNDRKDRARHRRLARHGTHERAQAR
jgi:NAD(P)-dependent dehydrogenase (short-subunit alcohol dehydrogenase family)